MDGIQAIDTMCRPFYARPEMAKTLFDAYEFQVMANTTFAGVKARHDIPDGEEWRVFQVLGNSSLEETIDEMDDVDVEYVFMDQTMQWSRRESELLTLMDIDELADLAEESAAASSQGSGTTPPHLRESPAYRTCRRGPRLQVHLVPPDDVRTEADKPEMLSTVQ